MFSYLQVFKMVHRLMTASKRCVAICQFSYSLISCYLHFNLGNLVFKVKPAAK